MLHIYGHLKADLKPSERKYILEMLESYGQSLRSVMTYFRGLVRRSESEYLAKFLSPYPRR